MKRICTTCGKPITFGCMTCDGGDFYAHEGKCFTKYMNKTYGKHKWMVKGDYQPGEWGGYYLYSENVVGGCEDTGIYYTEYTPEELE